MGLNRDQITINVRQNLDDAGIGTFWTSSDLNDSFQDAYDDVVSLSQCVVRSVTKNWISNLSYYDPIVDLGITDYMGTIAIFNNLTNMWLRDDLSLRNLDQLRRDWELWSGTPQFWCVSDPKHFAIAPKFTVASGSFKLVYWATAPVLASGTDTFQISPNVIELIEFYVTADMLEQAQEFVKASEYWTKYYDWLADYAEYVKANNKSDLLLRI